MRRNRNNNVTRPIHLATIVLDFDGTITEEDLLHQMSRRFGDPAVYHEVEDGSTPGRITLQEAITREYRAGDCAARRGRRRGCSSGRGCARVFPSSSLSRERGLARPRALERLRGDDRARSRGAGLEEVEILANSIDARPDGWRFSGATRRCAPVCGEACKRGACRTATSSTSATASPTAVPRSLRSESSRLGGSPDTWTTRSSTVRAVRRLPRHRPCAHRLR